MPPTVPGYTTKDNVLLSKLYTLMMEDVGMHNRQVYDLRGVFCQMGTDTVADIATASIQFHPLAPAGRPFIQHVDAYELNIAAPKRYGAAAGIDAGAWEAGISSDRINLHRSELLNADIEHVTCVIMDRIFATSGWYGGWMTPPPFMGYTFVGTHTHYLAADTNGVPTVTHASQAKQHIVHHGGNGSGVVGWMNSNTGALLEQSAEFADNAQMNLPIIQRLQSLGFVPGLTLAGVPHMINDWVPDYYVAYLDLAQKPMYWRYDSEQQRDLIIYDAMGNTMPNAGQYWAEEFVRWSPNGGPTVLRPNAGVVWYLNGASYVAPTSLIPTAVYVAAAA